jgi:S-formylglutathione hydrolase FrmB
MPRAAFVLAVVATLTTAVALARRPAHPASPQTRAPVLLDSTVSVSCPSASLAGALPALVYLPDLYGTGTRRYPVVYVLHGLPAGPQTYTGSGFVATAVANGSRPAIVVAPQGARSPDSDPEYLDSDAAENWPRAIADDLTRCIDARFRTIRKRSGRALVGFSAGGFGAMNIGLRNLATYGAVESWSGYFEATDPSGQHILNLGSRAANAAARVPCGAALARGVRRSPTFIGFYIGNRDGYQNFLVDNRAFSSALTASGIHHRFAVYPGAHSVSLWKREASSWLAQALGFLARLRARQ